MKRLLVPVIVLMMLAFSACITPFNAYLRNPTNSVAIVEVYLLDKQEMKTLPNQIKVADSILEFKGDYKRPFRKVQNVKWIDTVHFRFELQPHTTADLTDMTAGFTNSYPHGDFRVTVTTANKVDTLLNGSKDFRYKLFQYKNKGLSPHILYYDVK